MRHQFAGLITFGSFCLNLSLCQRQEHVAYLLSTGFSSLTGMTFTEMVLMTLCFPSDNWILKLSVRFSELSCMYISFIPMQGVVGKKREREKWKNQINLTAAKSLASFLSVSPSPFFRLPSPYDQSQQACFSYQKISLVSHWCSLIYQHTIVSKIPAWLE